MYPYRKCGSMHICIMSQCWCLLSESNMACSVRSMRQLRPVRKQAQSSACCTAYNLFCIRQALRVASQLAVMTTVAADAVGDHVGRCCRAKQILKRSARPLGPASLKSSGTLPSPSKASMASGPSSLSRCSSTLHFIPFRSISFHSISLSISQSGAWSQL